MQDQRDNVKDMAYALAQRNIVHPSKKQQIIQYTISIKNSSMFQPGLSQSSAWQWVCADWVQSGWDMRGHPAREGGYETRADEIKFPF
jgi:hypothetical protein